MKPASVGPFARAVALLVDDLIRWSLIVGIVCALSMWGALSIGTAMLAIVLVYWLYGVVFEVLADGQTPGKKAQRISVVNVDGTPIRFAASTIRNLLLLIDALPFAYVLGLITMATTRRFQRIGDLAAGTQVVYLRAGREPWGAADLGCVAVREAPAIFYATWVATALPIVVLCMIGLWSYPGTAGFLLWWFKPVYERLPLWIASRRAAGKSATLRGAVSNWRMLSTGLLPVLTYRRLSPTRSLDASHRRIGGTSWFATSRASCFTAPTSWRGRVVVDGDLRACGGVHIHRGNSRTAGTDAARLATAIWRRCWSRWATTGSHGHRTWLISSRLVW